MKKTSKNSHSWPHSESKHQRAHLHPHLLLVLAHVVESTLIVSEDLGSSPMYVTANRRGAQVLSDRVPRSSERYSPEREIGFDAYVFWCLAAYASVVVLSEVGSRPGEMSSSKRAFARETCLHASSGEKS
ncbi:hypothetical protein DEO72_LG5g1682 [Vigna unguiculata]|uniref:Uncharacterized protein n=1 Tax=Vigna unguiculata TaxID=3917 RepID=A0A4D6LY32_VIGUN|nr:hypothetical protein DEO72_LG5g1682 [Vigna unguiculata]